MDMTRRGFVRAAVGVVAAGVAGRVVRGADAAGAGAAPTSTPAMFGGKINVTQLADGLHLLEGAGGNVVVLVGDGGLFVIDSGVPTRGAEVLATARKLAGDKDGGRRVLFDTHWHFDHAGGNGEFAKAGFAIIGSTACRKRLGERIVFEDLGMTSEPVPEGARPGITFERGMEVVEGSRVVITKVDPAHTDTDAVAYFEKFNVLHSGDVVFSGTFPVIDRSTGGSLDGMIAASKTLLGMGDEKTTIVPGHGPMGDKSIVRAQLALMEEVRGRLAPLGEKHATMEEVVAKAPLADLDDKWGRGFVRSPLFTRMAYGQWVKKE